MSARADEATAYADDVLHGSIVAGPYVRDECRRHLNDIKPKICEERGWRYDVDAVERVLAFYPRVLSLTGDFEGLPFELRPYQKFVLGRIFGFELPLRRRRFRYAYVETSRGPLALDTPVLTARGWSRMGDLKIGDRVFTPEGLPTKIVDVSPVFFERDCYELRFADGERIVACSEHEWLVQLPCGIPKRLRTRDLNALPGTYWIPPHQTPDGRRGAVRIASIKRVDSVPVRCITVEDESHMFLAGRGLKQTSNSGKSPLAAGLALYLMLFDAMARAEVYICASKRDQSLITFKDVLSMVQQSQYLSGRIPPVTGGERMEQIRDPQTGSILRPLAFESSGRGYIGLRPYGVILDELHDHPSAGMVDAMISGCVKNRRSIIAAFTNSGVDKQSVCHREREMAIKASRGDDPRLDNRMSYVCAVDKDDDPFDDRCAVKTNPALNPLGRKDPAKDDGIPGYASWREARDIALSSPASASAFLRFHCCVWAESYGSWLGAGVFKQALKAGESLKIEDYKGKRCWLGADFALRRCMAAIVLVFESAHPEHVYDVFAMFWMASGVLREAERRDHREGLYQRWRDEGYLSAPPGDIIDYQDMARYMAEIQRDYDVMGMAYDRRFIEELTMIFPRMEEPPTFPMVPHPQGFANPLPADPEVKDGPKLNMQSSIKRSELLLRQAKVRVAPNPILSSHVASTVAVPNRRLAKEATPEGAENIRLDSSSSSAYIDGTIAMVQAIGYAEATSAAAGGPLLEFW